MQMSRKAIRPQAQMPSRRTAVPSLQAASALSLPGPASTTTTTTKNKATRIAPTLNKKNKLVGGTGTGAIAGATSTTALPTQLKSMTPPTEKTHPSTLSRTKLQRLVRALATFRPKGTGEIQFYNFLREICIIHSCSLEEAIDRAPAAWRKLKPDQQRLYEMEMRQVMPIPVPFHLIYDATRDEQNGRLTLVKYDNGHYVIESYSLLMHERHRQHMKAEQKYLAFFEKSNQGNGDAATGDQNKRRCRKKRLSWQNSPTRIRRIPKCRHAKQAMPLPLPLPDSVKQRLKLPGVTKQAVASIKLKPTQGPANAQKSRGGPSGDNSEHKLRRSHYSLKRDAGDGDAKSKRSLKKKSSKSVSLVTTPPTAASRRITVRTRLVAV